MTTEYQNIRGNRKHKDALFRMVFSKKEDLLDLYNAVRGTNYQNADELEVNTLENVLYMTIKNDVSFVIDCTMNLYEHQSSYNPNMPLRGMLYFAQLYSKYADQRKLNLYNSTLQKIPTPQFIVFYNGLADEPDRQVLRLSDAFQIEGGCLECEATMLNINFGCNKALMEKCRRLEEYSIFIATVRKYAEIENMKLGDAIKLAIEECIKKEVLSDILTNQRAEVFVVLLETFDKELYERDLRENIRAEVLKEVREEALEKIRAEVREEALEEVKAEVREEVKTEVKEEVKAEVKEEVREAVIEEIRAEAKKENLMILIRSKVAKGKSTEEIADALEVDVETIKKWIKEL